MSKKTFTNIEELLEQALTNSKLEYKIEFEK